MLKFQLATDQDKREAAKIERRRQIEEERKKRIFDAKTRMIGVDLQSLNKQIAEKKKKEYEDKVTEEAFAKQQLRDDQVAILLQKQHEEEKKKVAKEICEFRKMFQKPEDRREYDLNDPQGLKKDLPARLNDDDPRCGLSSAQKFQGEDFIAAERKKYQAQQSKAWLQQQIMEKRAAEQDYKVAEETYLAAVVARDKRALELQKLEDECKKRLEAATMTFNKALADDHKQREMMRQKEDLEDNQAEMYNILTGDFLLESPDLAESNMGPNRKLTYAFKGLSTQQKLQFRDDQMKQIEDKKVQKEAQWKIDRYWDEYAAYNDRQLIIMDKELKEKQIELTKKLQQENLVLAKQQKEHQEYMNKIVFMNKPTAEFYENFNKSTR